MAQERQKKLILKLNLSLKFMVEDDKSFRSSAPMLLGEEFAKQAIATVEQVKAMKKLNIPLEKKSFSGYHPQSYQSGHGGKTKSGRTRYQPYYKGTSQTAPVVQPSRTKQSGSKELKLCKLSKRNYKLSPYFEFNCNSALDKEGYSNKFACWLNKRVHRELGLANTRSLGTSESSGFSVAPGDPTNPDICSTTAAAVEKSRISLSNQFTSFLQLLLFSILSIARLGINRDTGNDREKGYTL